MLNELLKGQASKEIARTLDIAEGTVKIHLAAIYRALGVRTRAEAIAKLKSQLNQRLGAMLRRRERRSDRADLTGLISQRNPDARSNRQRLRRRCRR